MLKSIHFKNFKALRDCTLPLGRVTVLVGPNGCGKSTVLQAVSWPASGIVDFSATLPVAMQGDANVEIGIAMELSVAGENVTFERRWRRDEPTLAARILDSFTPANHSAGVQFAKKLLGGIRVFQLDPQEIARQVPLQPNAELDRHGFGLAGVLDQLRDKHPEKFEILNRELVDWLPEFDRILFEVPSDGARAFALRLKREKLAIRAQNLSDGTLLAVALLTLAHLPDPPTLIGLEEPDQGIHPRLLRHVQDAIYRLAYPESAGEPRAPVQVIVTTHSPYFLDLFKDSPEEIVTMDRDAGGVRFNRLADRPSLNDILPEGALGELWYSGLLGGVPAQP